jgi:hypothetical protein
MSATHKQREQVFAVVRVDLPLSETSVADSITVKEILSTRELAEREVERLSRLNSGKGCLYFATPTRVFPPATSAGPENS